MWRNTVVLYPRICTPDRGRQSHYISGTFQVPGAPATFANGINNASQIPGAYVGIFRNQYSVFLRDMDGSYTTIMVPEASNARAYGINDAGQIAGSYFLYRDEYLGFLATPK